MQGLPTLALLLAAAMLSALAEGCRQATAPPRGEGALAGVVLVTIDTLRADHVGAYGGPVPTPVMDRLAREGALFESAFTPTPSTAPAHASLFTGRYVWNHGVARNGLALPPGPTTLAEVARRQGMETGAFVSSAVLHPSYGLDRGFDEYTFVPDHDPRGRKDWCCAKADLTTDLARRWLESRLAEERPFFLFVHYLDPHRPYTPPAELVDASLGVDLDGKRVPEGVTDEEALRSMIRRYRGEVGFTDRELGRLLGPLEGEAGADVAIVVTSDHGEGLGDHGLLEHGDNVYDEQIRIPLIVRGPRVPAGQRLAGPVQLEDVFVTLASWLGAPAADPTDGRDLLPWLRGAVSGGPRESVLGQRAVSRARGDLFFERTPHEKWIGSLDAKGRVYDLARDPQEAAAQRGAGAPVRLRAATDAASGAEGREVISGELQRALRELGYVE